MTKKEMLDRAKAFMVRIHGRPEDQEDQAARDIWHLKLGVISMFIDELPAAHELIGTTVSYYGGIGTVRAVSDGHAWVEMNPGFLNTVRLDALNRGAE